jgi:putative peptide zinc metalloprotease protein
MNTARRLLLLLLALLAAAAFGLAQPGLARAEDDPEERPQDNAAIAINTKDGSSLFRLAFEIRRVAGDIVDHQNVALAWGQCQSCRTTAIAIQIVLVEGSPSVVTPVNLAVAVNTNCNLCQTFATAYQFVVGTNGPVEFTKEGKRELARIHRELRRLRKEDLSPAELDARVKALMERVRRVLAEELVPARDRGDGGDDDEDEEDGDDRGGGDDGGADAGDDGGFSPEDTTTTVETQTESVETETTPTTETETTPTETTETTTTP